MRRLLVYLSLAGLAGCRAPTLVVGTTSPAACECAAGWACCPNDVGVCVRDLDSCPSGAGAAALPPTVGEEFSVDVPRAETDYGVARADTAFNAGVFLVAWQSQQKGLLAARYDRSGHLLDETALKVAPNEMRGNSLRVVPSGEGFAVVWVGGASSGLMLYGAFVDASGAMRGPFGVSAPSADCDSSVLTSSVVVSCTLNSGLIAETSVEVRGGTWQPLTTWRAPSTGPAVAVAPAQHAQAGQGTYGARLLKEGTGLMLQVFDDANDAVIWSTPVQGMTDNVGELVTAGRRLFSLVSAGERLVVVYREDTGPFFQPGAVGRIKAVSLKPTVEGRPQVTGPVLLAESAPIESKGPTVVAKRGSVLVGLKNVLSKSAAVPFVREYAVDTLEPLGAMECNDDAFSSLPYAFSGAAFDDDGYPLVLAAPPSVGSTLVAKVGPGGDRAAFSKQQALMGNTTAQTAPAVACANGRCVTSWVDSRPSAAGRSSVKAARVVERTGVAEQALEVFAEGEAVTSVATDHELLVAAVDANLACATGRTTTFGVRAVPAAGELAPAQFVDLENLPACERLAGLAATALNGGALFAVLMGSTGGESLSLVYRDATGRLGEVAAPSHWPLASPTQVAMAAIGAEALIVVKNAGGTLSTALVEFDDAGAPHARGVVSAQADALAPDPTQAPDWGRLVPPGRTSGNGSSSWSTSLGRSGH